MVRLVTGSQGFAEDGEARNQYRSRTVSRRISISRACAVANLLDRSTAQLYFPTDRILAMQATLKLGHRLTCRFLRKSG
jgi:hypothetical protein